MARGPAGPREFVRLTPVQFSISVSIVVLLLAGAGLAGYFYGIGEAEKRSVPVVPRTDGAQAPVPDPSSSEKGDRAPVTFYTVLTEPRKEAAPPPAPEPEKTPEPAPEKVNASRPETGGSLILQVASYKDRDAARRQLDNLLAEGYAGSVQVADLGDRGTWYRVRIGPYKNEKDALKILEKLREERNLKGYIVR